MKRKNSVLILGISLALMLMHHGIFAQDHNHNNEHAHVHHYDHPANEIGIGNFLSYLAGEKEYAFGQHIHYLRSIRESRFGFGIGFEQIYDEHKHRTLGLIGSYRPISYLILSLSPGILFPNEENPGIRFALHSEVAYEFEINNFHLGPTIEFSTSFEEFHVGLGVHIAFAF